MVVVIPVDADVNKAENVAQKHRNRRAKRFREGPVGTRRSKTMIVIMMAKTPSLKASSRPLFIADVRYRLRTFNSHRAGDLVLPIEGSAIPFREIGRGGIGVLKKLKNCIGGIFGGSRIGVIENEFAHLLVKAALAFERRVLKAVRRGCGIGIESAAAVSAVARPKACADHLMRIGFRLNRIGTRPRRRSLAIESRDSQIKRSPEEMDRADLAIEIG